MLRKYARRVTVLVVGVTVLLIGIAMLVLPGPALVVIPIGLAILATEYAWARRCLSVVRETAEKGADTLTEHPLTRRWFAPLRSFIERVARLPRIRAIFARRKDRKRPEASHGNP
ncbi:MAG: hypothetical protein GXX84_04715 [Acidobacteria bacterium]|nr:hypothetical protein [Acidobacteriota bacterium]